MSYELRLIRTQTQYKACLFGGYCCCVVVLNLFIIVLCGFVYFCNVWGCVCVGFVLYGYVRLM